MPHQTEDSSQADDHHPHRSVVLCFDGTGNQFQGNDSDTNIVKFYQMLQKHTPGQYHYYQPGIGTYIKGQSKSSSGINPLPSIQRRVDASMDQAIGSSFVDHVLGGYEFIMRYYQEHDDIYIFGFSRGAYTARFLAQMIFNIGLLAKGNEEMVYFAWDTFSKYQQVRGHDPQTAADVEVGEYMLKFKDTFCRPNIGIHFLGMFDCVNSVGQFEIPFFRNSYKYIAMPPAKHIRHAVSIHERRLKFKPALFFFPDDVDADFKEQWFAGNHGDVGGGYKSTKEQSHLLSDIPLNWMVQEVLNLPGSRTQLKMSSSAVEQRAQAEKDFWNQQLQSHSQNGEPEKKKKTWTHDLLAFDGGSGILTVLAWWILELLPIFARLELEKGEWVPRYWPPNLGAPRDIPRNAIIHESVDKMLDAGILDESHRPKLGGDNSNFEGAIKTVGGLAKSASRPVVATANSLTDSMKSSQRKSPIETAKKKAS